MLNSLFRCTLNKVLSHPLGFISTNPLPNPFRSLRINFTYQPHRFVHFPRALFRYNTASSKVKPVKKISQNEFQQWFKLDK